MPIKNSSRTIVVTAFHRLFSKFSTVHFFFFVFRTHRLRVITEERNKSYFTPYHLCCAVL